MKGTPSVTDMRNLVVGVDETVELLDGTRHPYINFDNASSTPFLRPVLETLNSFATLYASVGRGSGYKSHVSTEAFDAARATIGRFVGASLETHAVILGKNTTEALNKLAHCLELGEKDVVLTSLMEHHSNDLPWRRAAAVHHIGLKEDGSLDVDHLRDLLKRHAGKVRLVTITGASNVTGFINPIHEIAETVHEAGAMFGVDAAQLAPHRTIDVGMPSDPRRIDFLAYTGHKMYAPLGIGALVALREAVSASEPDLVGGGTVDLVTEEDVVWSSLPAREEAGTQNVVGAVAWAQAIDTLSQIGMDRVAEHEAKLTEVMLPALQAIDGVQIFGDSDPARARSRLGVTTFRIKGIDHKKAAAILGYEGGIGVRAGMFCAHPYVQRLLGLTSEQSKTLVRDMRSQKRTSAPGLIRASFGIYNVDAEIERFVQAVNLIVSGRYEGEYVLDPASGAYKPLGAAGWGTRNAPWSPRDCT